MSPAELADLYAAGALLPHEAAAFEKHVAMGDAAYVGEYQRVKPVLEILLLSAGEVVPPPGLRERMAHDLGAEGGTAESPFRERKEERVSAGIIVGRAGTLREVDGGDKISGITITRAGSQGRWYPTGIRGVRFRQLHASRRENRRTIILEMDPGTELPDHGHTGTEEITMISGDLSIAGTTLGAGDYIRIAAGAEHGVPRTTGGCVCIITSGYQPFPVSSWIRMAWAAAVGLFKRK